MKKSYSISSLCNYLNISVSAYYYYFNKYKGVKRYNQKLLELINKIHSKNKVLGYRRINIILKKRHRIHSNSKTILKYMQILHIKSFKVKKKYSIPKGIKSSRFYPNLVKRNFKSFKQNKKWLIDITYLPLKDNSRSYMVCIKDTFDKRIVNYNISKSMNIEFVVDCIKEALKDNNIQNNELIIHSDQ